MKKEDEHFFNWVHTKLNQTETPVRQDLWEHIAADLEQVAVKRSTVLPIYRWVAAAAVLVVLAGASATLWYLTPQQDMADAFQKVATTTPVAPRMAEDDVVKPLMTTPSVPTLSATTPQRMVTPAHKASYSPEAEADDEQVSVRMTITVTESYSTNQPSDNYMRQASTQTQGAQTTTRSSASSSFSSSLVDPNTKPFWQLGLYGGISPGASNDSFSFLPLYVGGISVRSGKPSSRWSFESGLRLSHAEVKTKGQQPSTRTMTFLGIPLKANYDFYKHNDLKLYASAGGTLEQCVHGPTQIFQGYAQAGLGIEYGLGGGRFSLYAEPSVHYAIDNGSSVSTLAGERPFNMQFICGLRMYLY